MDKESQMMSNEENFDIPQPVRRRKSVGVYCIWCHYRPVLDHQKYPHAVAQKYSDDIYEEKPEAQCRELEKQYPQWMFWPRKTFVAEGYVQHHGMPEQIVLDLAQTAARHDRYISKPVHDKKPDIMSSNSRSQQDLTNSSSAKRSHVKSNKNKVKQKISRA